MTHIKRRERRKRIAEYIKSGKTTEEAMKKFQVGKTVIFISCKEFSVLRPSRVKGTTFEVIALRQQGMRQCEIMRELNFTDSRVSEIIKAGIKAGIKGLKVI